MKRSSKLGPKQSFKALFHLGKILISYKNTVHILYHRATLVYFELLFQTKQRQFFLKNQPYKPPVQEETQCPCAKCFWALYTADITRWSKQLFISVKIWSQLFVTPRPREFGSRNLDFGGVRL